MKLTKEQKERLAGLLTSPWGSVHLICDGYRISLHVRLVSKTGMTYRVLTYVNGWFRGEWCGAETEHPEQKFLRKSVRSLCPPSEKKKAEKALGKRYVAKSNFYNGTLVMFHPDWASGKAAIAHLCRVCDSVEVAPEEVVQ